MQTEPRVKSPAPAAGGVGAHCGGHPPAEVAAADHRGCCRVGAAVAAVLPRGGCPPAVAAAAAAGPFRTFASATQREAP
eukprot:COSAG01_NODE_145_length_24103_cov_41.178012_14_plen_79_part_00